MMVKTGIDVRNYLVLALVCIICQAGVLAQSYNNPFELENRLEQKVQAGERGPITDENPFEISYTKPSDALIIEEKRSTELKKVFLNKKRKQTNLAFWICFSIIFLFAIVFSIYRNFLFMALRSVFNKNLLGNLYRDRRLFRLPLRLYYLIYLLSISFFVAKVSQFYFGAEFNLNFYFKVLAIVSLLVMAKHLVIGFVNYIVPTKQNYFAVYNFLIFIFGILLGILLLPFNMVSTLEYSYSGEYLIYILFGLVGITLLIRYLRGLVLFQRYLPLYFFQFFIYLCTVEIAPILLIRNYFLSN